MTKNAKVLIVGGGFGGVKAALNLNKVDKFDVTLLTDEKYFNYYPTIYKTALGSSWANSQIELNKIFEKTNINLEFGRAVSIDRSTKSIKTVKGKQYPYDYLILSLGVVTNYFNIPGLDEYAFGIKSIEEVIRFKKHLHDQLKNEHQPDLNYVIVGAGPTGIELAGALPSYLKKIMLAHGITNKEFHIDIIEALPRLLPNLPKLASAQVKRQLKKLGINLYLNSKVEAESSDTLKVNGKYIKSHTVIWTAGVTNNPFYKDNNFILMKNGKVAVDAYLKSEPNIFVIGDNANTPYSGMAQTALQDGQFVSDNLIRLSQGKQLKSYSVKKPITVIPAGPKWALVLWGTHYFPGIFGYLLREAADLRGFHNIESWPNAITQYLNEFVIEEECQICTENTSS